MKIIRWRRTAALQRLLACAALLAAQGAVASPVDAQQRGAAPQRDCVTEMGALPPRVDATAFAIDGDTLAGVGLKPRLRLWGIQAPELRDKQTGQETVPGMRARAALDDLLAPGNRVTCRVAKFDRYCRYVAQCVAADGATDLGAGMLTAGQAYGYWLEDTLPWAPAAGQAYIALERAARAERRGLWADVLGKR